MVPLISSLNYKSDIYSVYMLYKFLKSDISPSNILRSSSENMENYGVRYIYILPFCHREECFSLVVRRLETTFSYFAALLDFPDSCIFLRRAAFFHLSLIYIHTYNTGFFVEDNRSCNIGSIALETTSHIRNRNFSF